MKVADLVKWLHPDALDFGLILKIGEAHFADQDRKSVVEGKGF